MKVIEVKSSDYPCIADFKKPVLSDRTTNCDATDVIPRSSSAHVTLDKRAEHGC